MPTPAEKRCWTLEAACQMLGEVRRRTADAVAEVEPLLEQREALDEKSEQRAEVESQLRAVVSSWVRSMEALGLEVKGLWLVDFDNGSGYYCWRWPEQDLEYFHGYEEGFSGRVRIQ